MSIGCLLFYLFYFPNDGTWIKLNVLLVALKVQNRNVTSGTFFKWVWVVIFSFSWFWMIVVISSMTNTVFFLIMYINTPMDVWMIYTEHLHRPIVFVKVFVDVTWTTVDIWYIVTHEIMRDCVLLPAAMEFLVMEKRPEEVRALDSFIWWILRVRCLLSVQSDSMRWITCDPVMCLSEPA